MQELVSALSALKTRSSPGLDRIDRMLQLLLISYQYILLNILNGLIDSGFFPDSWHHSLVFFIPKSVAGKFRPISLTSCLLKIFERLVLFRLIWWVESAAILPAFQFGFCRRRSCLDNLGVLTAEIQRGFIDRQFSVGLVP